MSFHIYEDWPCKRALQISCPFDSGRLFFLFFSAGLPCLAWVSRSRLDARECTCVHEACCASTLKDTIIVPQSFLQKSNGSIARARVSQLHRGKWWWFVGSGEMKRCGVFLMQDRCLISYAGFHNWISVFRFVSMRDGKSILPRR